MNKPVIEYLPHHANYIQEGQSAVLFEVYNHPKLRWPAATATTSPVLHVFEDGEFETQNTIYVPRSN